jgi:FG-GAP repeat
MSRDLQGPSANIGNINKVLTLTEGGTGASSVSEAVSNLNAVSKSLINKQNGIAGLDSNGKLPPSILSVSKPTIKGSTLVSTGQVSVYTITNFDSLTNYDLTAVSGTVMRSGDTVTFTAPTTACISGFQINGHLFEINVGQIFISKPVILSPIHLSTNISSVVNLTASSIKAAAGTDTHVTSLWELSEDINFHNAYMTSGLSTVFKTSWNVAGLTENKTYYARVKYTGSNYGQSDWSDILQFKTKNTFIPYETAKLSYPGTSKLGTALVISNNGGKLITSDVTQTGLGSVYVYNRTSSGWSFEGKIVSNDSSAGDLFGKSLSLSSDGNNLIVGSPGNKAVYSFTFTNGSWVQNSKIVSNDVFQQSRFGWSVSLNSDGSKVAIGDPDVTIGTSVTQRAVYIFNKSTGIWIQESKLVTGDTEPSQRLGWSVSMAANGLSVVSGACKIDNSLSSAVYCFVKNVSGWMLETRLVSYDNMSGDLFGFSLDLTSDGLNLIIGAPGTLGTGVSGTAYLFSKVAGSWQLIRKEMPNDGMPDDNFGYSVAISDINNKIYVGTPNDDTGILQNKGSVYIFSTESVIKLQASDGKTGDAFGSFVSTDATGTHLSVSAFLSDSNLNTDQGSVYIFE